MLKLKTVSVVFLALVSTGCARDAVNSSSFEPKLVDRHSTHHNYSLSGPLTELTSKIITSQWAENCDKTEAEKRLEVANALDQNADAIMAAARTEPDSLSEQVQIGPTYFNVPPKSASQKGWQSYKKSWAAIYSLYQRIKTQTPNSDDWQTLNASVRGILADDDDRIFTVSAFILGHDDERRFLRIIEKLEDCAKKNCVESNLKKSEEKFLTSSATLRHYFQKWKEATDQSLRIERRGKLIEILNRNYNTTYAFHRNENVSRPSRDKISLRMNAGAFAGAQELLSEAITSIWSAPKIKVEIDWVDLNIFPGLYTFAIGHSNGERAFTDRKNKIVQMYPANYLSAIAHEVGHVLGFPDEYYTIWDENKCEYTVEYSEENLMSVHSNGLVTPKTWKTLAETYSAQ